MLFTNDHVFGGGLWALKIAITGLPERLGNVHKVMACVKFRKPKFINLFQNRVYNKDRLGSENYIYFI